MPTPKDQRLRPRPACLCVVAAMAGLAAGTAAGGGPEAPERKVSARVREVIRDLQSQRQDVRREAVGRIRLGDPEMEEAAGDIAALLAAPSPRTNWEAVHALSAVGFAGSAALRRELDRPHDPGAMLDLALALRSVTAGIEYRLDAKEAQPGRSARSLRREAALARVRAREALRDCPPAACSPARG